MRRSASSRDGAGELGGRARVGVSGALDDDQGGVVDVGLFADAALAADETVRGEAGVRVGGESVPEAIVGVTATVVENDVETAEAVAGFDFGAGDEGEPFATAEAQEDFGAGFGEVLAPEDASNETATGTADTAGEQADDGSDDGSEDESEDGFVGRTIDSIQESVSDFVDDVVDTVRDVFD